MENRDNTTEDHLLVLQKFINVILFGKVGNPNFKMNSGEVMLQDSLINFYISLYMATPEEQGDLSISYYQSLREAFRKKLRDKDFINLMNSYGLSNIRVFNNLHEMLNSTSSKKMFDPQALDNDIAMEMIFDRTFPDEILRYLEVQFFDIFQHLPSKSKVITEEKYRFLVERYVCNYDYNKMLNIVYRKYDEIE